MSAGANKNAEQSSQEQQQPHEHQTVPSDMTLRVKALESLLIEKGLVDPAALDALADEVCRLDQQACSSPQWVLVDSDDPAVVQALGDRLAEALNRRAPHWPALVPTDQEASEITTRTAMARLDQSFKRVFRRQVCLLHQLLDLFAVPAQDR